MMNIAQIGVGYWGPNILRNLIQNERCAVSYVSDISSERRDYVRGLYPAVQVVAAAEELFERPEIDAIVIATPVATHFEMSVKALEAGKHILVEKPMARSTREVEEIGRQAAEKNLVAMVGHTFLFNAAVRHVKKIIDSEELGRIRYIYSRRLNLGRIRSDIDALWNFAPHDISIIQYWLGDPNPLSVLRRGVDYIQEGVEDVVFLSIMYPKKIMANIHVSWLDPQRVRSMVVVGSRKMIVYDDVAENKVAIFDKGIDHMAVLGEHMDFDDQTFQSFSHRSGDVVMPKIDFEEPLKVEVDHFIDCIEDGVECITGVDHAKKVVGILEHESS